MIFLFLFQTPASHFERGYLNANVSIHQTVGTVGSTNRKHPLLSEVYSGAAGGCGWGNKRRQSFIEGFRA